jgi:catechol 2,3-dioxygenase-like lactoylglutathione lyase family enzyme
MKKTGLKHLCLKVQNIEKARIHLMEAGIEDVPEASLLPFGNVKCFSIRDPNGIWIEILQDNNFFSAGKSMPINDSDIVYLT